MKIIFLNTLDAELQEPLRAFLLKHLKDTDVFCLEECYQKMDLVIEELFTNFTKVTTTKPEYGKDESYSNVLLVKNDWTIESHSANEGSPTTGLVQYATISKDAKRAHVANIHGITRPGKLDTPERIMQSQEVLDTFAKLDGAKIIGGDLNVLPETKSAQLFRDAGYDDLISKYDIKTTRNEIAWRKYPGDELYYSDYVFVQGAEVTSFEVPGEIISDHQPMIVHVNIA